MKKVQCKDCMFCDEDMDICTLAVSGLYLPPSFHNKDSIFEASKLNRDGKCKKYIGKKYILTLLVVAIIFVLAVMFI